jgi:hypothetical protein
MSLISLVTDDATFFFDRTMVVSLLNNTATAVQYFLAYLQKNAWPIIGLLVGGYYLKTKGKT